LNNVILAEVSSPKTFKVDKTPVKYFSSFLTLARTVLFFLLIFGFMSFSLVGWLFNKDKVSPYENRRYVSFPHLRLTPKSIAAFPAGFESYLNDRFPLRFQLTALSNFLKWKVFNTSGNEDVLIGKDGWLFFLNAGNGEFLKHDLLTDEKLEPLVRTFENRRKWLAMHHIKYLLVFVPCKCEIYREKISSQYKPINPNSIRDQVVGALKQNSSVDVLDLTKQMLDEKRRTDSPLYLVTDTHWNQLGAFVAYKALANRLHETYPAIKPIQWQDLKLTSRIIRGGDLSGMLGLRDYVSETVPEIEFNRRWVFSSHPTTPDLNSEIGHTQPFATEVNNPSLPRAYFVRDSFTIALQPYLSQNFRRALFHWNYRMTKANEFPSDDILNEHPDILIQEMAENVLAMDAIHNPPEVDLAVSNIGQLPNTTAN
jgi:SGNH hydrolase-like domain, acetyltransferase AlgX